MHKRAMMLDTHAAHKAENAKSKKPQCSFILYAGYTMVGSSGYHRANTQRDRTAIHTHIQTYFQFRITY